MKWQEETTWLVEYHEMHCARDRDWNQTKTAEQAGMIQQWVSERLVVYEESKFIKDIWNERDFSTAHTRAKKNRDRRNKALRQSITEAYEEVLSGLTTPKVEKPKDRGIITADFCEWAETYTGPKFNFLHCDFPYGINANKRHQGNSPAVHGGYDDSEETYWTLLKALCKNLDRICADSAHIMFWFSMHYYHDTLKFFAENSDFIIDPFPLIWVKSDGKGLLPDPMRGPRRTYETCLFGSRGDHKILTPVANACYLPTDPSEHMSAKPEPVLKHFFRMFIDGTSRVLDPTCGSGTVLRAAEASGAAQVCGIEIDPDFAERAVIALDEARRANGNGRDIAAPPIAPTR
jgi:hypothetical protein